jgi:hypothetical protein
MKNHKGQSLQNFAKAKKSSSTHLKFKALICNSKRFVTYTGQTDLRTAGQRQIYITVFDRNNYKVIQLNSTFIPRMPSYIQTINIKKKFPNMQDFKIKNIKDILCSSLNAEIY